MAPNSSILISSGVEPVDNLQGGLRIGAVYLVHNDAADPSLFATKFLIEGLKRGETGALIMNYSPEEAVRRFGLLGYDCLEDIYAGRLVILEYTQDTIQQISALTEFAPVLRELEWLLGETKPTRIVFDPITAVLARNDQHLPTRVRQFSDWTVGLGATVVLTAASRNHEVISELLPLVAESFRFGAEEAAGQITRSFTFEKSPGIPPQKIEIDYARGIFLVERLDEKVEAAPIYAPAHELADGPVGLPPTIELDAIEAGPLVKPQANTIETQEIKHSESTFAESGSAFRTKTMREVRPATARAPESDEFGEMLREMMGAASVLELGFLDEEPEPLTVEPRLGAAPEPQASAGVAPTKYSRAADFKIGAAKAARAAESLLRAPAVATSLQNNVVRKEEVRPGPAAAEPAASGFNVLVVNDDEESRRIIQQSLGDYSLQFVHDGISALARLISFKPDLVVLDVDLPIVDGFKVLEHIRSSLNVPVIVVSGSRVRASDRVLSTELGADHFLTKPFSAKELATKARQLIARHRGIPSWIVTGKSEDDSRDDTAPSATAQLRFTAYDDFAAEVEKRVETATKGGAPFSVVGCRLSSMTAGGGRVALQLFDVVHDLARDTDITSTNARNDLLILLPDANAEGARAFASRLRARVVEIIRQEPTFWIRTFPESALAAQADVASRDEAETHPQHRRASDEQLDAAGSQSSSAPRPTVMRATNSSSSNR